MLAIQRPRDHHRLHLGIVDEHDAHLIGLGPCLKQRAITARAAIVCDQIIAEEKTAADAFRERFHRKLDGLAQRRGLRVIQSATEEHHVRRSAAQSSGGCEGLEGPLMCLLLAVKRRRETLAHLGGRHRHRVVHADRLGDPVTHEIRPRITQRTLDDMA